MTIKDNTKILITGSAGFIGSHLCTRLLKEYPGIKIVGVDDLNDYYDVSLKKYRNARLMQFPGYVFVHMIMNNENWYIVRNTRGVTGFVGSDSTKPLPLSEEEMVTMGVATAQEAEARFDFKTGDTVRVINGVWVNAVGVITSIDESQSTVKISIPEFMNGTPVGMNAADIVKMK